MLLLTNTINLVLFCDLILLISSSSKNGDEIKENDSSISKSKNDQFLLIFNAAVLWPFSIYDIVFPIIESGPRIFVDMYDNVYKTYNNVSRILMDLKQRGFRLYAILNVITGYDDLNCSCIPSDAVEALRCLPKKREVDAIFRIFRLNRIFDKISYYRKEIGDMMEIFSNDTGIPFENMLYFDNSDRYDERVVFHYRMFRYTIRNGIAYIIMKNALALYCQVSENKNVSISF